MSTSPKTLVEDYLKKHFPDLTAVVVDCPRGQIPEWRTEQFQGPGYGVDLSVGAQKPLQCDRASIYPGEGLFALGEPLADGQEDVRVDDKPFGRNLHSAVKEALKLGLSIYMAKPTLLVAVYDVLLAEGSLVEASVVLVDGVMFPDAKLVAGSDG